MSPFSCFCFSKKPKQISDKSTGDVDLEAVKKPISKEGEIGSRAVEVNKRKRKGNKDGGFNSEKISEAQRSNKSTTEVDLEAVKEPISKESEIGSQAVEVKKRKSKGTKDGGYNSAKISEIKFNDASPLECEYPRHRRKCAQIDASEADRSYLIKVTTFDLQGGGLGGGGSGGSGSGGSGGSGGGAGGGGGGPQGSKRRGEE